MTLNPSLTTDALDALTQAAPWRCRVVPVRQLSEADIEQWQALAMRAGSPNAYLTPAFALAAWRHLDPDEPVEVHLHERHVEPDGWRLQGLALLKPAPANRHLPLRHVEGYQSRHGVLGGVLLARDGLARNAEAVVEAWHDAGLSGVVLSLCAIDDDTCRALVDAARQRGRRVEVLDAYPRAMMAPQAQDAASVSARLPSQTKRYLTGTRKADPVQRLSLRVLRGAQIDADAIERHLALEHAGWKGEEGTSMRSDPHDEAFFHSMFSASAQAGRAVMVELLLGEKVIHSSSNLIDGDVGHAFKVGFDPAHAKLSPGILGEVGFLLAVREALPDLRDFDSGANADSFITGLWPDRRTIGTLVLSTSWRCDLALTLQGLLRNVKRTVKHTITTLRRRPAHEAG